MIHLIKHFIKHCNKFFISFVIFRDIFKSSSHDFPVPIFPSEATDVVGLGGKLANTDRRPWGEGGTVAEPVPVFSSEIPDMGWCHWSPCRRIFSNIMSAFHKAQMHKLSKTIPISWMTKLYKVNIFWMGGYMRIHVYAEMLALPLSKELLLLASPRKTTTMPQAVSTWLRSVDSTYVSRFPVHVVSVFAKIPRITTMTDREYNANPPTGQFIDIA